MTSHNWPARLQRLEQIVTTGDRRAAFEREYELVCVRDAESNREAIQDLIERALTATYEHEQDAPRIVHVLRNWETERTAFLAELEAGAAQDKERYVQARLKGWPRV